MFSGKQTTVNLVNVYVRPKWKKMTLEMKVPWKILSDKIKCSFIRNYDPEKNDGEEFNVISICKAKSQFLGSSDGN